MGERRRQVRPRYGRVTAALSSLGVTSVAVLGGAGLLPTASGEPQRAEGSIAPVAAEPAPSGTPSVSPAHGQVGTPPTTPWDRVVTSDLPADSGAGRRVVFSESAQRVWLNAIGVDDSGTMRYFVRFTQGDAGAAIGFHDIPVDEGGRVQTVAELGTPTSHGCIRQRRADARAMWDFAGLGTTVVVVA